MMQVILYQEYTSICLMILAGLPAMMQLSGKVPWTTLPAPTTTSLPIVVPLRMMLFHTDKAIVPDGFRRY